MEEIRDGLGLQKPKKKIIKYNPTNFVRNKDFNVKGVGLGGRHEYLVKMLFPCLFLIKYFFSINTNVCVCFKS